MKMYHPSQKSKRHDRILAIQFLSLRNPSKLSYLINDRFKKYLLHPILFVWRWTKVFPNLIDFNLRGDRRHPPLSLSLLPPKRILCHPKIARPDFTNRERRRRNDPPLRSLTDRFPSK